MPLSPVAVYRWLQSPRGIRWAASVSPGAGQLLLRRFVLAGLLAASGAIVDWFAMQSFRAAEWGDLSVFVAGHFALVALGFLHADRTLGSARGAARPRAT